VLIRKVAFGERRPACGQFVENDTHRINIGAVIHIHPAFDAGESRVHDYGLANGVGRVSDAVVAISRIAMSGHITRYRNAKVFVPIAAGGLPLVVGRLKRNHAITPGTSDPAEALSLMYTDTIEHDPRVLRFVIEMMGADRVMLGSDMPFPIGDHEPMTIVKNAGLKPDQIELTGNRIVSLEAVLQQFVHDHNRSVLLVALDTRRSQIEQIPWVESASVQRILPNRIRVELTERTPVAFARNGNELALIDAHGVILERPQGEDLRFPIVSGVSEDVPRDQREKRMQVYMDFTKSIDMVRAGSSESVSELDLSNPKDLRAVMTGLAGPTDSQAVTIHFGAGEFTGKYKMLVDNFSQWQANTGRVQSIDLQYMRQVVVNPDPSAGTTARKR
jgi:hypothetical protein